MARPSKLAPDVVDAWLALHAGWVRVGEGALGRTFSCGDFATAIAFAVRVGMLAEKRDHHPDLEIGWGRARVVWSTHDAGGVTTLDLELAEATDRVAPAA